MCLALCNLHVAVLTRSFMWGFPLKFFIHFVYSSCMTSPSLCSRYHGLNLAFFPWGFLWKLLLHMLYSMCLTHGSVLCLGVLRVFTSWRFFSCFFAGKRTSTLEEWWFNDAGRGVRYWEKLTGRGCIRELSGNTFSRNTRLLLLGLKYYDADFYFTSSAFFQVSADVHRIFRGVVADSNVSHV
jgi:hypothetical protein